eukprot:1182617-Pleurochrysis_carterae.AAC.2
MHDFSASVNKLADLLRSAQAVKACIASTRAGRAVRAGRCARASVEWCSFKASHGRERTMLGGRVAVEHLRQHSAVESTQSVSARATRPKCMRLSVPKMRQWQGDDWR